MYLERTAKLIRQQTSLWIAHRKEQAGSHPTCFKISKVLEQAKTLHKVQHAISHFGFWLTDRNNIAYGKDKERLWISKCKHMRKAGECHFKGGGHWKQIKSQGLILKDLWPGRRKSKGEIHLSLVPCFSCKKTRRSYNLITCDASVYDSSVWLFHKNNLLS